MSAETNRSLRIAIRATIGGRPISPLFTRGSAYFETLIACECFFFVAHVKRRVGRASGRCRLDSPFDRWWAKPLTLRRAAGGTVDGEN